MSGDARFVSLDEAAACRGAVVVVDVLRAFTTAAMALLRGAERIYLTAAVEQAWRLLAEDPALLLAGEQDTRPIEGFDFSNSPVEMIATSRDLTGARLAMLTTSGTRGAVNAADAAAVWCAGFVSADRTAQALGPDRDVTYVVSGRSNQRAGPHDGDDDLAVAELIDRLRRGAPGCEDDVRARVRDSRHAERLRRLGHPDADVLLATSDPRMAPAMLLHRDAHTAPFLRPA